jgi:ABC-type multidrug transport system permease subunit
MVRIIAVIKKCIKEQFRSFWILLLTVSTAPFFVVVYDLITASYVPVYDILVVNNDNGIQADAGMINLGDSLISYYSRQTDKACKTREVNTRAEGEARLKDKRGDLLMVLPGNFSVSVLSMQQGDSIVPFNLEFMGNITDVSYIVAAVLSYSFVSDFVMDLTGLSAPFQFVETAIGSSGNLTDFELAVPGLIIFSIIMLMLTASVAMVTEAENKTLLRLRLSHVSTFELMGGITVVQIPVGLISLSCLAASAWLGFGSRFTLLVFIVVVHNGIDHCL